MWRHGRRPDRAAARRKLAARHEQFKGTEMHNRNEPDPEYPEDKGKGYLFAVLAVITCPCHLPLTALFLGGTAAGALFAQYFILFAVIMGIASLISFVVAARILL
jgi:mercuric ion transport protein